MKKRQVNREIIRLTATVRVVRKLGHKLTTKLTDDSAFWHEFWIRLAPAIGWNEQDEARVKVVADDLKPLLADLTVEEQLAKIKEVLATGWDVAHQSSGIHRAMERLRTRIRQQKEPPDSP